MREILFRGKRVDNDEWVYGFLICMNYIDVWEQKVCYDGQEEIKYCTTKSYQVKPETVSQFTGLTDKNGEKIFEGDIISYIWVTLAGETDEKKHLIAYNDNKAKFVADCITNNYSLPTFEYVGQRGKIIGNRWDNPELLQEE